MTAPATAAAGARFDATSVGWRTGPSGCPVRWIRSARYDLALAGLWLPFAVLAWSVQADGLAPLLAATLVFSALHQPLTLVLVYGDRRVRQSRAVLFAVSPVLMLALVVVGMQVSLVALAIVAGVWNAVHTLQQRYGVTRIYGRKGGDGHGRSERALLYSGLGFVVVAAAANPATASRLADSGLGGSNRQAVELLVATAPVARVLLPLVGVAALAAAAWWASRELRHGSPNPAKWFYLASTGALFVVIVVDPVVGLVAYVGSHAAEYFMVVYAQLPRRHPNRATDGGALVGRVVRSRAGRAGFFAGYAVFAGLVVVGSAALGYPWYTISVLTVGGLHLFYDGLIWKLRSSDVARGFGI